MVKFFPLLFVFLWSSAFITTKPIIDYSDPFAALAFRFLFVAFGFFLFALYKKQKIIVPKKKVVESLLSGVLFHGFYLGGVFFSISKGMPAGITALIVTLQPILTNVLAGPILKENVSIKQWVGVCFGFAGAVIVLGFDIGTNLPVIGVLASFIALFAITTSTLWQKKLSYNLPLSVSNIIIILFFTQPYINFSQTFLIAISHQILLVSFGAFTILMYLIKNNSASKTVSVFFLIPPISAVMAYLFLDESLAKLDILGLVLATIGDFIATRKN
jgi:drug/metabolite transporter (DMT)-like permease